MNKKQKLLAQKAAEQKKLLALDALAVRENRDLTAEEKTQMQASIDLCAQLDKDIVIAEAVLEAERAAATVTGASVGHDNKEDEPFASLADQMRTIKAAAVSPHRIDVRLSAMNDRLMAAQGGSELVESDGGFLLAPEYSSEIFRRTFEQDPVASRCNTMPMGSNRLVIPAANDASRADGQRNGGITSFWTYEAGTYNKSKPTFRNVALQVDKLTVFTYGTDELLGDAPAWKKYIDSVVPDEFGFKTADAIFNGPGTGGGPLGINNSGAIISFNRTNSGAAPINTDIFAMYKRLPAYLRKDAAWFINQDMEDALWNLTRGSGTAVELLYTPPGGRGNDTDYGKLLGKPVIPIEQAATTGTQGDITFGAFSEYTLGQRGGIKADSSIHVAFITGEQAFRWQLQLAGECMWDKPVTPKNGSFTQSPFIQLNAA